MATTLDDVPDPVFAQRMMGDGVAIQPLGDTVVAPFDGEVVTLHDAGHAVSLRSAEGAEVLIHIGLDTVMLKGEGFTPLVAAGDTVARADPLNRFDLVAVALAAHKPGDQVDVKVQREAGGTATVEVTLGELPPAG